MTVLEEILVKLLVDKTDNYKAGDVITAYVESYAKVVRIKGCSGIILAEEEYEIMIDDREFNQLLYCV